MNMTPAWAGFFKGILMVIVLAVVSYLGDAANLTGLLSPALATLAAAIFSGIESNMKANSGNSTALFGAVRIK